MREELNLWFLLQCRSTKKTPKFISNLSNVRIANVTNQSKYRKAREKFQKQVLNMAIRDAFRKIAHITSTYNEQLDYFRNQPDRLRSDHRAKNEALDLVELYGHQIKAVHDRDKKHTLQSKLNKLSANITEKEPLIIKNKPRVTYNIGNVELEEPAVSLLSKGPKFAVLDNSKSGLKRKLEEAEVGLERYAYAVRWAPFLPLPDTDKTATPLDLRNPEKRKSQPPPRHPKTETKLRDTKVQILNVYKQHQRSNPQQTNITEDEDKALKELKKNKNLIIKQSDKDKQFVVVPTDVYKEHAKEMLEDTSTYQKVIKNPLPAMISDIELLCEHLIEKYPKLEGVEPYCPRLPEFYGTYKTHKKINPPPLRPVTSQVDSPGERLGHATNHILKQALQYVPVHLKDSTEARQRLQQCSINSNHMLITADVKSLYTNIPLEHGVKVVSDFIKHHRDKIDMLGIEHLDFVTMLKTVTQSAYFRFDEQYYRQTEGLGMGVKPAPPFAIIYVYLTVEKPLLEQDFTYSEAEPGDRPSNLMPVYCWNRYVDDCITIGEGTENDVRQLFKYVNTLNPKIQFTYEANPKQIDFLDLTIHLQENSDKPQFELFIKPTSLGIFLNYNSGHPRSTIMNSARNELLRAVRNGSTDEFKQRGVNKIKDMLLSNDFTPSVIERLTREINKDKPPNQTRLRITQYLSLPYVNEYHKRKVYQILRQNDLLDKTKVSFYPDKKLGEILTRSALHPTPCNKQSASKCYDCGDLCMQKNIAYKLTCNICNAKYCGETGRFKRNRCWEHLKSVRNKNNKTAMGKHYLMSHPEIKEIPIEPFKFEVLKVCKDYADRMIWQSLYIKQLLPKINTQLSPEADSWQKTTWAIM